MLARANRVIRPVDFRATVRTGKRVSTSTAVVYVNSRRSAERTRFGFIVSKTVGTAVRRNRVRRRLRAIGHGVLLTRPVGSDIVVRALPSAARADWDTLRREITAAIDGSE